MASAVGGARTVSTAASTAQINELKNQLAEMQAHCEGIEKERDFYFDSEYIGSNIMSTGWRIRKDLWLSIAVMRG